MIYFVAWVHKFGSMTIVQAEKMLKLWDDSLNIITAYMLSCCEFIWISHILVETIGYTDCGVLYLGSEEENEKWFSSKIYKSFELKLMKATASKLITKIQSRDFVS